MQAVEPVGKLILLLLLSPSVLLLGNYVSAPLVPLSLSFFLSGEGEKVEDITTSHSMTQHASERRGFFLRITRRYRASPQYLPFPTYPESICKTTIELCKAFNVWKIPGAVVSIVAAFCAASASQVVAFFEPHLELAASLFP